jgi:hypothetical protein
MNVKLDHVMQFKVTLKGIKPPIWRRIQVPCTYSFWDLHVAIQDAMGWLDSHLHQFIVPDPLTLDSVTIGIPYDDNPLGDDNVVAEWDLPIAAFFTLLNREGIYEYDFGDNWKHSLLLEKIFPLEKGKKLPACTGGRRACPPEDCGGVWGYYNLLAILSDPQHEEYSEMSEWVGSSWDADAFNPNSVVFSDPDKRWNDAFR